VAKRIVLAVGQRDYAVKLAAYLREEEPDWELAVFTQAGALRAELQQDRTGADLLVGQPDMLCEVEDFSGAVGKAVALVTRTGEVGGRWPEIVRLQPLTGLLSEIRAALSAGTVVSSAACRVVAVFSASGGTGKTAAALNLLRQAGERGWRTFYFNLEALNATSILFGRGEPDSLTRLLYSLQAHPEQWDEQFGRLCRHQPHLRTDFIDAPDDPGERLAMPLELVESALGKIRAAGRYDLIVIDTDSGTDEWHRKLLRLCDQVVWLLLDDPMCLAKADKLLRHWQRQSDGVQDRTVFVLNKALGFAMANRWTLPGGAPAASLPYVSQWKALDQPGRLLAAPAFCGAVDELLDQLGITSRTQSAARRREGGSDGARRTGARGAG